MPTTTTTFGTDAAKIVALLQTAASLREHSRTAGSRAAGRFSRVAQDLQLMADQQAMELLGEEDEDQ
jgi:hypothetical protein